MISQCEYDYLHSCLCVLVMLELSLDLVMEVELVKSGWMKSYAMVLKQDSSIALHSRGEFITAVTTRTFQSVAVGVNSKTLKFSSDYPNIVQKVLVSRRLRTGFYASV